MAFQDAATERTPKGFVTSVDERTGPHISCMGNGTTGARVFLVAFGAFALLLFVGARQDDDGTGSEAVLETVFATIFLLFSVAFLLWVFCGRTDFVLGADSLTVEKRLLAWRKKRVFPKGSIHGVRAVRTGGRDATGEIDSFASFGLVLEATEHVALIGKLDRAKATWLGLKLAKWANVPFHPAVDVQGF